MELKGLIDEIIYHNEINGYTVCTLETDDELITAVGYLPFINSGDNVILQGNYVKHAEYGEQFKIESFEKTMPQDTKSLEKYLASGIIKGIGEITAFRIIERFGEDTINVLKFEGEKLSQIKGISHKKAIEISETFNKEWELWQIVKFLENYGVGANHAKKVYKELGTDAIEKIEKNPYILLDILYGVNFKEIDKIGIKLGIDFTNETRVQSGIKYAISIVNFNGHTCVLKQNLIEFTKNLLSISEEQIENNLINLKAKGEIVIQKVNNNEWVYLEPFYKAEENIANKIKDMSNTKCKKIKNISAKIMHLQEENGLILSEEQVKAIETAVNQNICIITGGPGTGKTTIIKFLIQIFEEEKKKVILAAPTGRAAKRMTESTGGFEAKTLHRALEIGKQTEEDIFNRSILRSKTARCRYGNSRRNVYGRYIFNESFVKGSVQ